MPNLLHWDPLRELGHLRDTMNRMLEDGLASVSSPVLAVDVYETADSVVIEAGPLGNIRPENIEVSITGNTLTIKGKSQEPTETIPVNYLRKERHSGSFSRSIVIPRAVKAEQAVASLREGILAVTVPKTESDRPRVINIETHEG